MAAMSRAESPSLDALDAALAAASPKLTAVDLGLAVALYQLLAAGEPVGIGAAAARAQVTPEAAEATLTSWPAVFFDDSERVVGFWGLALGDMAHRLRCGDAALSAWCAWDPLFLARIIGALEVSTNDPVTGEEVTYRVDHDGVVSALTHSDSVLSFLAPDRPWDDEVVANFCHYISHFATPGTAEIWTAQHPGTFVLGLGDAVELARRHVERALGPQ
jgi:hypothetical protein